MIGNRWFNLSVALIAGLIGGMVGSRFLSATPASAQASKSITAQAFYLVDQHGTRMADLIPTTSGGATLTLYDHGGATVSLHATGGVSGLSLFDHHATMRLTTEVEHDGNPAVTFFGPHGQVVKKLP